LEAVGIVVLEDAYTQAMDISDLQDRLSGKEPTLPSLATRFTVPGLPAKDLAKISAWQAEKDTAPIATRDAVWKLTDATEELIASTERSSQLLIRLTMALVALTIAIVGLTALLVVLAL
jgi:hypothetical protein